MFARSGSHDSYQPTTVFHWLIEISVPKLTAPPQAGTAKPTVFTEYRPLFRSQFDPSPRRHIPAPVYPAIVRFPADNSLNPASHRPHKTHPQPGRAAARPHHRAGRTPNTGTDAVWTCTKPSRYRSAARRIVAARWPQCGRNVAALWPRANQYIAYVAHPAQGLAIGRRIPCHRRPSAPPARFAAAQQISSHPANASNAQRRQAALTMATQPPAPTTQQSTGRARK